MAWEAAPAVTSSKRGPERVPRVTPKQLGSKIHLGPLRDLPGPLWGAILEQKCTPKRVQVCFKMSFQVGPKRVPTGYQEGPQDSYNKGLRTNLAPIEAQIGLQKPTSSNLEAILRPLEQQAIEK